MLDMNHVPEVDRTETLSRFVVSSRHIRNSNETVKADAFVPHPYEELSVNRDKDDSHCGDQVMKVFRVTS